MPSKTYPAAAMDGGTEATYDPGVACHMARGPELSSGAHLKTEVPLGGAPPNAE